jgi:[FeFe] hydrogenase H-cluster maturation GTPase HydF
MGKEMETLSLSTAPRSERLHIAILGRRNVGKSSLINALTGQEIAVVSPVKGTTTDPVFKAMELLPLGPVVFIDTAGLDDEGDLGELRRKKTLNVIDKTDVAILVVDANYGIGEFEEDMVAALKRKQLPVVGVVNKIDQISIRDELISRYSKKWNISFIKVSAATGEGIEALRKAIIESTPVEDKRDVIVRDLFSPGDFIVLITPIDKSAPKGRLILPQQQVIRDILDGGGIAVVTKEDRIKTTLEGLSARPRLAITDSQVFHIADTAIPNDIPLTSFSILFARYKGDLQELVRGVRTVSKLEDGDRVLIAEACTHHVQDDDIARVKIPRWLRQKTGRDLRIDYASGTSYPENLKEYSLVIHCGGCMLNQREMKNRIKQAVDAGVPIVNYGVFIAYVQGILDRALQPFGYMI